MSQALEQRLKDRRESFTESEQRIASYLLQNLRDLPFETAASLAKRVGVSPMTVGRFLRTLGYEGVGALKEELRGTAAWRQLYAGPAPQERRDAVAAHLEAEVGALTAVHTLPGTREWAASVRLLARADRVSVASFQTGTFLGLGLATLLQQLRPRVSFNPGSDGAYIDMLLDSDRDSCVVLIDARRYFRQFRALSTEVVKRSIPLLLITDTDCYWARDLTRHVLMVPAERLWHSYSAYTSLFSLLAASLIEELGDVMDRLGDINQLRQELVGYVDTKPARERESGNGHEEAGRAPRGARKSRE
jgi:DNA-binding MurR/RpiR family transcriptional regulator